ncbi:MAG: DUF6259 domain-containing protein [Anaerolineae bacterium]|nr:DUF6259 domain-containing protein [Anaerolineae bacterium]
MQEQDLSKKSIVAPGELRVVFERTPDGIRLQSLSDTVTDCEFLSAWSLPLFTVKLRHCETKEEIQLDADSGWGEVAITSTADGAELGWQQARVAGLQVIVRVTADSEANALRWSLRVENPASQWSVWRVVFPQIAITELDPDAKVFFPRAPGEVQKGLWRREFRHHGLYPEPWTTMQFMAAYDEHRKTGLYVAMHDPNAGAKDITVASSPEERTVTFTFDHPAEAMGVGGNGFVLSGEAVWQLLRGDWFDAALIYRQWLRREARWYPELGPEGRADTPQWMRELPVWTQAWGDRAQVVSKVKAFAEYMDVPVGFHWYGWHQIPFDNDYPHYFPVKEGFAEGVQELRQAGIYVMPYINGRLWDMHDRGVEDYQFTSVALPAATKDEQGQPYEEKYGSKEADGSPVRFAVMCPSTELWQNRIRSICLRLFDEYHVDGVYIDQISAMSPKLCFDKTHGHPLGGGHWWVEGYWEMLQSIRDRMPEGCMLTSECNSEPFARWFDGYLTWTWQHDGQVPAFMAVYGSAIQMFGRAYGGGETKSLALRMKAGQQLVFGEQIGWMGPEIINEEDSAAFLRQMVRLRWRLRRYFYTGTMCRPPRLEGDIPTVRADWKWREDWWVTTDAVMTGAWRLPEENKLVLMFVNVSDSPVSARFHFDGRQYGVEGQQVRVTIIDQEDTLETFVSPSDFDRELRLPPCTAYAWEVCSMR